MRSCGWLSLEPSFVDTKRIRVAQCYSALNHILQLADVSRPIVLLHKFQCLLFNRLELLPHLLSKSANEVFDQDRNIGCSLVQRGHFDRHNIQPVKEVLAKVTFAYELIQIAMGCGQHSNIYGNWFITPNAFDLALLQHSQQCNLNIRRQVPHFIQKNGPPVRGFKASQTALCGARKRALFVPEEFGSNQRHWYRSAIHADKRLPCPFGTLVDGARNQLLACTGLTKNENS